jgi:hypothetical protein
MAAAQTFNVTHFVRPMKGAAGDSRSCRKGVGYSLDRIAPRRSASKRRVCAWLENLDRDLQIEHATQLICAAVKPTEAANGTSSH